MDGDVSPGEVIVRADLAGTVLFAVTAAYAAIAFDTPAQWVGAVTALGLFAAGVAAFLWSYWNAVQRSRHDQIAVSELYFLLGSPTPGRVRAVMLGAVAAQLVIAAVTTFSRPNGPDGDPGSSLAVGFLVPMFGLGLNGMWAAYHGEFPARVAATSAPAEDPDGAAGTGVIGHNDGHG